MAEDTDKTKSKEDKEATEAGAEAPEGMGKAGYAAELLAYEALEDCAHDIAAALPQLAQHDKVLIVDSLAASRDDAAYQLSDLQLSHWGGALKRAADPWRRRAAEAESRRQALSTEADSDEPAKDEDEEEETAAPGDGIPYVGDLTKLAESVAGLLEYLKPTRSITSNSIKASEETLRLAVAGKLATKAYDVLIDGFWQQGESPTVSQLAARIAERYEGASLRDRSVVPLRSRLEGDKRLLENAKKTYETDKDNVKVKEEVDRLTATVATTETELAPLLTDEAESESTWKAFDAWVKSVSEPASAGAQSPLSTVIAREQRSAATHLLFVKMSSMGAQMQLDLWRIPLPGAHDRALYTGGGVASYILVEKEGKVLAAGTANKAKVMTVRLDEELEGDNFARKGWLHSVTRTVGK